MAFPAYCVEGCTAAGDIYTNEYEAAAACRQLPRQGSLCTAMTESKAFTPLVLPNGTRLPNRIAKAAMEENIADIAYSTPSEQLIKLYDVWARGGSGTIITGHVMVDRSAMAGPGDVALDEYSDLTSFREWAKVSKRHGAQVWMQINHPGRQMRADLGLQAYAPSAVSCV